MANYGAQVIAELAALAREVADEARCGERFDPPLNHAELPSTTPSRTATWRS